jgi:hypothetical protein
MYLMVIQYIKATGEPPFEVMYLQWLDIGKICFKSWQDSLSDSVKRLGDAVSALRSNLDQHRIPEARVRPLSFECQVLVWLTKPAFNDCEQSTRLLRVAHVADVSYTSP